MTRVCYICKTRFHMNTPCTRMVYYHTSVPMSTRDIVKWPTQLCDDHYEVILRRWLNEGI